MSRSFRLGVTASLGIAWLGASLGGAADTPPAGAGATKAPASTSRPSSAKGGRGPLPDPVLLDGSALPAENRPEHGMVGDFELPGNETSRNGKVGGQQTPQMGGGMSSNIPMGMPQGAAGAQGAQGSPGGPQGPQGQQGGPQGQQGQQGQQAGGPPPPGGAQGGQNSGGPGEAGATAEGIQVAGLAGEASSPNAGVAGKPQQVSIGDSASRIEGVPNSPDVVGAQTPAGPTQQHEKGTGTGGRGASGAGSNKGVERGRTMPAGL